MTDESVKMFNGVMEAVKLLIANKIALLVNWQVTSRLNNRILRGLPQMHGYYRLAFWSAQWDIRIHFGVNSEGECLDHVFADAVWAIMVIELIRNVGGDQFSEVDGGANCESRPGGRFQ